MKEEGTGNSQTEQSGSVQKEMCTYKEGLSIMRAVDELRKSLELSLNKISSDSTPFYLFLIENHSVKRMMEDSVDQKYEAEAIAIEKEENWKREKTELIDEMRRLQQETESGK